MRESASAGEIRPFLVMEILERAQEIERSGADIVHLEVGEPDFPVPPPVARAAEEAIRRGDTHYTHSLGIRELREEISRWYARRIGGGFEVDPDRVIVTTGSSGGLSLLMALLLDAGDEVLLPDPGYACYPNFVRSFKGVPRFVPLDARDGFRYSAAAARRAMGPRTRALIVNSPANPTAAIQPPAVLRDLVGVAPNLISDEIYQGLEYGERSTSLLEITQDCFVLDGFSKRHAMTGLRIGWLVAPHAAVPALQRIQQNLFICAGSVAQRAAIAALREGDAHMEEMRAEYEARREILLAGLLNLGFGIPAEPRGAYYILADARHVDGDSLRLARTLLEEAHVGVAPGIDFGSRAEGHLRFSFASARGRIEEGLRRLRVWLETRRAARP